MERSDSDRANVGANVIDDLAQSQKLRDEVLALITPAEMRDYARVRTSRTLADMLHINASLVVLVGLTPWVTAFNYQSLGLGLVLIVLIGTRFNAINVQIHEASHFLLFRNRKLNDYFVDLLLAYPALQNVASYRESHKLHHRYLRKDLDPDQPVYADFGSFRKVIKHTLLDLSLITVVRAALGVGGMKRKVDYSPAASLMKLMYQGIILLAFVALHGPVRGVVYYGMFWLYPLLAVFPLIVRLRTVVQHFDPRSGTGFVSRTTVAGVLQHYFIGAAMDYHFEHHLFPALPYYGLARLNERLGNDGFFNRIEAPVEYLTSDFIRFFFKLNRA